LLYNTEEKVNQYFSDRISQTEFHKIQKDSVGFTFLSDPVKLRYPEDIWLHVQNPYIYSVAFDNLLQIRNCHSDIAPRNSSYCRTITNLMRHSNKYYPFAHAYKRPWNSSDYPLGAVEEELIECQKSV